MFKNISKTSVALSNYERQIVQSESEKRGLFNFSATLRQIIREWEKMQQVEMAINNDKAIQSK